MVTTPTPQRKTNPITSIDLDDHTSLDISGPIYDALRPPTMKALHGVKHCVRNSISTTFQQEFPLSPDMKVFSGTDPFRAFPHSPHSSKASEKDGFTFSTSTAIETEREIKGRTSVSHASLRRCSQADMKMYFKGISASSAFTTSAMLQSKRRGQPRPKQSLRRPATPKPAFPGPSTAPSTNDSPSDLEITTSRSTDKPAAPKRCPYCGDAQIPHPFSKRTAGQSHADCGVIDDRDNPRAADRDTITSANHPECYCGRDSELVSSGNGSRIYRCAEGECVFSRRAEVGEVETGSRSGERRMRRMMEGMKRVRLGD